MILRGKKVDDMSSEEKKAAKIMVKKERRSTTVLGDLPPIGGRLPRFKSAPRSRDHIPIMPRSHVSVARFYDWTDDLGDCFSVSRLYREIASIPRMDSKGTLRANQLTLSGSVGTGCASNDVGSGTSNSPPLSITSTTGAVVHYGTKGRGHPQLYMSPGRMFVRDKKALTRGEREIIEGIYKNRGDVAGSSKDVTCCSEFRVRSHQDAWLVGKSVSVPYASLPEGANGALGRAIMKGVGLDTPNSGISGGGSLHDTISQTLTSSMSADDVSSPTIRATIPSDVNSWPERKQKMEKCPNLPPSRQSFVLPEPMDHSDSLDKSTKLLHGQNLADYWDSRPSAPPSSPNQLEESPISTLITQHSPPVRLDLSPLANCGAHTPEKLLGMRPKLPPNAIIIAEKIQSVPSPGRANRQQASHSGFPAHKKFNGKMMSPGQLKDWSSTTEDLFGGNIPVTSGSNIDRGGNTRANMFFGSDFDDISNQSIESEKDKKKVQVRVYLPSVGAETHEDDIGIKSSLKKERPLSETTFKLKS
ncbi:hypothetical protein EGW08_005873 [Elysia chlorotica]|uniref:Uncharacterized protein n=1 Tax=Elysia chlorotica TaxID=188477 RepID=A0A3S1C963_ELYCH|nr:hypothetical protein EGW08_005873 [Elysia chlorotica]